MGKYIVPLMLLVVIVMGCVAVLAQKSSTVQALNGDTLVELPARSHVSNALDIIMVVAGILALLYVASSVIAFLLCKK